MSHVPNPADAVESSRPAFTATLDSPIFDAQHLPLVRDRVRHAGEGIAFIIAETLAQALDAAEYLRVEYQMLPAVVSQIDAIAPGAPQLWDGAPGNICFDECFGDRAATDAAFEAAHLVVKKDFVNSRIVTCQMEPRSAIGRYDSETGRYHLLSGSQGVVRQRFELATALGVPLDQVEIVCPDVGGAFGTRTTLYAEQLLVVWAAKRLGREIRWTSNRSEAFLSDYQGRDLVTRAALAFDSAGRILGMRTGMLGNVGAHTVSYVPLANGYRVTTTVYDVPAAFVRARGVLTNTAPTAPFRGAGRPEAHFVIERLLDIAAPRLGLDRVELRRRNLIPKAKLPYRNALGLTYDAGDFHHNLDKALAMADWQGFSARRTLSTAAGLLRGIGLANYVESPVGAPRERMIVRVPGDGTVEILAGTQSSGQGHETTFAQVVADGLGVDMTSIRLVTGDTSIIAAGGGTHSDRSMRLGGTLLVRACAEILEDARAVAARRFNCETSAVAFTDGQLRGPSAGNVLTLLEAARLTENPGGTGFSAMTEFNGRMPAYPTGCAICELEIDPETGATWIRRYTSVDDVGQPINPMIVDGQVHGGIAQGAGQALLEDLVVDRDNGEMLGGSFLDYGVPRADHFPHFDVAFTEDPTLGNPLRVKGGGESGITPASAAIINAVVDALASFGIDHIAMPATPHRIWRAIQSARARRAANA
jgi:carbon-monoxide dehydrogenase large subunit